MRTSSRSLILLILTLGFLANPIFDFISILLSSSGADFSRISLISRGLFISSVVFLSLSLATKNKMEAIIVLILMTPIISFVVWFLAGYYELPIIGENTAYLLKIISLFSFCLAIKALSTKQFFKLEKTTKLTLIAYVLSILGGALFGIEIFKSYPTIERFGYKGIVIAQNEASGLMLAILLIYGYKITHKIASKSELAIFGLASLASLVLGTKSAILMPLLVISTILISRNGFHKSSPYIVGTSAIIVFAFLLSMQQIPAVSEAFDTSLAYFTYQYENYANGNIITLLLSGRDNKIEYAINNYLYQNPTYIIIGGYPAGSYNIEIDFLDIALLIGLPLFGLYLFGVSRQFIKKGNTATRTYYMLSFFLIVLAANTGGHILNSALAIPFIAYFCAMPKFFETSENKQYA